MFSQIRKMLHIQKEESTNLGDVESIPSASPWVQYYFKFSLVMWMRKWGKCSLNVVNDTELVGVIYHIAR